MSTSNTPTSTLGSVAGSPDQVTAMTEGTQPDTPQVTATPEGASPSQAAPAAPAPTSRLQAIIQAVSKVGETALAGIPNKGRPSFVTGLGEGARSAQQEQATQSAIKFKTFDDSVRAAQLHNQDKEIQARTQAQADAHQAAQDTQHDWDELHGVQYQEIPNSGQAATDYLTAQSGNGGASIPAGTHLSADGKTILIPKQSDQTQAALLSKYKTFASAYNLPSLPDGAQFVPGKFTDYLQNKLEGKNLDGSVIKHDDLPGVIADLQTTRTNLAKQRNTDPAVLSQIDGTIGHLKENQKALDDHQASVFKQQQAQQLDTLNKSEAIKAKYKEQEQDNAAGNKATGDTTELNAVAFDPNYQNADGTKGANVVMSKADAAAKGLTHYKANPEKLNAVVAGMNDVQNKLNQLAGVVNDPNRMGQVDPGLAAAMLAHGKGITLEMGGHGGGASGGVGIDTSRANEVLYGHDIAKANQATKDFVTAFIGAHEAITQLPRLQTFGQSSRMTQTQLEAALNLLPQPGDIRGMASQKMTSLQGMIDPLRKQIPHMPGAETIPSWMEQRQQRQRQAPSGGSKLGQVVSGNATDFIKSLQPNN
jgi:hypothetical protein